MKLNAFAYRKKRSKQRAEYLQKQDDILSQQNKAKARARYKADPEKKKASVRDSYKADPEKKKAFVRDSYKADPEKKKASVRDSYNADIESKQSAKRQRYQEDLEENRAAKRQRYQEDLEENRAAKRQRYQEDLEENRAAKKQRYQEDVEDNRAAKRQRYQEDVEENRAAKRPKYEDNSAIKASERNRYWYDPAVRLAKRAAERKRYRRGHRTTTTTQRYVMACCIALALKSYRKMCMQHVYSTHVRKGSAQNHSLHMYSMHGDPTVVYSTCSPFSFVTCLLNIGGVILNLMYKKASLSDVLRLQLCMSTETISFSHIATPCMNPNLMH